MAADTDAFRQAERERARARHRATYQPKAPGKSCANCSTPIYRGSYCSAPECVAARNRVRQHRYIHERRARMKANEWESFDPTEVYERDGWICGICGDPVDPNLSFPDRMMVSLDHIIPVSLGGAHTRENTRCSHLGCNVMRGNRAA